VTLRLSKSLHFRLDRLAETEGVSLNSLLSDILQSGATALESGLTFGAISPHGEVPGKQVAEELAGMRALLDTLSTSQRWSVSSYSSSELLDPIRSSSESFAEFDFIRLIGK
jgi:hypothetical protein